MRRLKTHARHDFKQEQSSGAESLIQLDNAVYPFLSSDNEFRINVVDQACVEIAVHCSDQVFMTACT